MSPWAQRQRAHPESPPSPHTGQDAAHEALPAFPAFYLHRPSASSSLASAKLNSSLSPAGHSSGQCPSPTGRPSQDRQPQAAGEASALLQEEQASTRPWARRRQPQGMGFLLLELEQHPTANRMCHRTGPADALLIPPLLGPALPGESLRCGGSTQLPTPLCRGREGGKRGKSSLGCCIVLHRQDGICW